MPSWRKAKDGVIGGQYRLRETPATDYLQGTEWNVRDTDGTVVFTPVSYTHLDVYKRQENSRAVATTLSPASRTDSTSARPNPRELPVINQTFFIRIIEFVVRPRFPGYPDFKTFPHYQGVPPRRVAIRAKRLAECAKSRRATVRSLQPSAICRGA